MQLDRLINRCRRLEERAATLYRGYAAATRDEPELCALWTSLAREEEGHARTLVRAGERLRTRNGWRTRIDGWEDALGDVEERLGEAERLGPLASTDRQLVAALALETTELDTIRHLLLEMAELPAGAEEPGEHALRLAAAADRLSRNPDVRLQSALLRTRVRLKDAS